jgi:hypothetical protein
MKTTPTILSALFAVTAAFAQTAEPEVKPLAPPQKVAEGTWVESEGHGAGRADALANAIELAIQRVHGTYVAKGSNLRARMSLVKSGDENLKQDGVLEIGRVTQQLEGFIAQMDQPSYGEVKDGWQARVRCLVADYDPKTSARFVVRLQESFAERGEQHVWVLRNLDKETDRPTTSQPAAIGGSDLQARLVNTDRIKISATGPGVKVTADSDPAEAAKKGRALVASHRVEIAWSPVVVDVTTRRSVVPGAPRKQLLDGATMRVEIAVADLVEQTEAVKTTFDVAVPAAAGSENSPENRELLARATLAAAYDEVVQKIYFALRPPRVLAVAKSEGDTPTWTVEADLPFDLAAQLAEIAQPEFGVETSFGEARWKSLGSARLLPGTAQRSKHTATFALGADAVPDRIEPDRTRLGFTKTAK